MLVPLASRVVGRAAGAAGWGPRPPAHKSNARAAGVVWLAHPGQRPRHPGSGCPWSLGVACQLHSSSREERGCWKRGPRSQRAERVPSLVRNLPDSKKRKDFPPLPRGNRLGIQRRDAWPQGGHAGEGERQAGQVWPHRPLGPGSRLIWHPCRPLPPAFPPASVAPEFFSLAEGGLSSLLCKSDLEALRSWGPQQAFLTSTPTAWPTLKQPLRCLPHSAS